MKNLTHYRTKHDVNVKQNTIFSHILPYFQLWKHDIHYIFAIVVTMLNATFAYTFTTERDYDVNYILASYLTYSGMWRKYVANFMFTSNLISLIMQ